jgi:hypothetical protein
MKRIITICVLFIAFATLPSQAQYTGWGNPMYVTEVQSDVSAGNNAIKLTLSTDINGTSTNEYWFIVNSPYSACNEQNLNRVLSILLAAQSNGKKVKIYMYGDQYSGKTIFSCVNVLSNP